MILAVPLTPPLRPSGQDIMIGSDVEDNQRPEAFMVTSVAEGAEFLNMKADESVMTDDVGDADDTGTVVSGLSGAITLGGTPVASKGSVYGQSDGQSDHGGTSVASAVSVYGHSGPGGTPVASALSLYGKSVEKACAARPSSVG